MARIRTIKPDFFRHELLQDLEERHPKARVMLVFAGLWTVCDSKGKFRDKPRTLKLDILPFLGFDMDKTLAILEENGFIKRYQVDGERYGCVLQFEEHQRITGKEAAEGEKYPDHVENEALADSEHRGNIGETSGKHPDAQEGKGKEREKEGKGKGDGAERSRSLPEHPPVITLPLNTGEEYHITENHLAEYTQLYPAVDTMAELRKMRAWCISNPKNRKTQGGVLRFVNGWLAREQDRGGRRQPTATKTGSTNGRTYAPNAAEYVELAAELGIGDS